MVKVAPSQLQTKGDARKRGKRGSEPPVWRESGAGLRAGEESHRTRLGHPTPPTALPEP